MQRFVTYLRWATLTTAFLLNACVASTPRHAVVPTTPPTTAVLFGYIPDAANDNYAALKRDLIQQFQAAHPSIPLQLTIDPNLDLYDLSPGGILNTLLGNGPRAANVVELDTLLLGDLVANNWVQPLSIQIPGILPSAWQAATVGGRVYGVPTYLCSNVIYARSSELTSIGDGLSLLKLLSSLSPNTPLVGNYAGSWTLPSTYLDAWADTNDTAGLAGAYLPPVDTHAMIAFKPLVQSCASGTANPCLDGTYASGTGAETSFAVGHANGFVGYTERLFYILSATSLPKPNVVSAALGYGTHPVMFVDVLAINPNCVGSCLTNAQTFIQFMSQVGTRNLIAFSQDAPPGAFPRYLLQANRDFYSGSLAQYDPYYPQFWNFIQHAVPFPNQGFPKGRKPLGAAVKAALGAMSATDEKHN